MTTTTGDKKKTGQKQTNGEEKGAGIFRLAVFFNVCFIFLG